MIELRKALYRYDETANLLSVSRRTITREVEAGKLDVVFVRNRPRITADSIRRYIEEKVREAANAAARR